VTNELTLQLSGHILVQQHFHADKRACRMIATAASA
jgi:cyanophycinase-like exopeptidase